MQQNNSEISAFIWEICDDLLRGLFKPSEYRDVILPFTVLRRIDCVLEPHKEEILNLYSKFKTEKVKNLEKIIEGKIKKSFINCSKYDLKRLNDDPNNVILNFKNYIAGFSSNVKEIIDNFNLEEPVSILNKNKRFFKFIEKFSEVDLHPEKFSNHQMGQIFEELLRISSEVSNETSGEHYTPRDVVKLLVSLVFTQDKNVLKGKGNIRSIFDPCCGSGGMLTISKEWVHKNINPEIEFRLLGQEYNPKSYSICKSDMMIIGENPNDIKQGSSLSEDKFKKDKFDYLLTNPPYGVSWKTEKEFVLNESNISTGRFSIGTPRIDDGQLLFLQHMISKMETKGSRIGIVLNGSPMFTGDAGSGESEIRKWIIENDWLECIISLPDQLFFNTGIPTYIWIISNKKTKDRKNKIQLIDGTSFFVKMKKSLGEKRKKITKEGIDKILELFTKKINNKHSKIYNNEYFGYTKVVIEQPLIVNGSIVTNSKGKSKPDNSLKDYEYIPLSQNIDEYFENEVLPHLPNAWMNKSKNKVGYEINFYKHFYKFKELRSVEDISKNIKKYEKESDMLLKEILK